MAGFKDFDDALRDEAESHAARNDTQRRLIELARNTPGMETVLVGSFAVFEDWYKTIVTPRTDLRIIVKKKEQSDPEKRESPFGDDHYIYRESYSSNKLPL